MEKQLTDNNLRVEIHTSKGRSPNGYGGGNSANAKTFNRSKKPQSKRYKYNFNICTWNVQGLGKKQKEVIDEIERMKVDVAVLTETKKKGQGQEKIGIYHHIWSGVNKNERAQAGVSILVRNKWSEKIQHWQEINERIIEIVIKVNGQMITIIAVYGLNDDTKREKKDEFFELLGERIEKINKAHEVIIIGDLNCRVGKKEGDKVIGKYGEETKNDNGNRLIELCKEYKLMVANTFFAHKDIHKYTWIQPTRKLRSIIDLVIVKQERNIVVRDVRTYRKPECGSDHHLVMTKLKCNGYKNNRKDEIELDDEDLQEVREIRYNVELLQQQKIKELYQNNLDEQLQLNSANTTLGIYEHIVNTIHKVAEEVLGRKKIINNQICLLAKNYKH